MTVNPDSLKAAITAKRAILDTLVYIIFVHCTEHPKFYNQLFTGADEVGVLASFLSVASNTNVYTYEMAPVFSLMESEVLQKLRELVGWKGGMGDGIFSPGGSMSNMYGLVLARYFNTPESKVKGILSLPQMAIFCSEDVSCT